MSHSQSPRNLEFERCTNFCLNREGYFIRFFTHLIYAHLNLKDQFSLKLCLTTVTDFGQISENQYHKKIE